MIFGGLYVTLAQLLWSPKIFFIFVIGGAVLMALGLYLLWADFLAPMFGIGPTTGKLAVSDTWHYIDDTGQVGPVSFEQLRKTLANCQNPRDVFVWRVGFPNWVRAGNVPELRAALPPPLPGYQ